MTKLQIGAQMYSVRDHSKTYEEILDTMKKLKSMGYNTCQLSGHGDDITAQQLKDALDQSGLACVSTHISFEEMENDFDRVVADHKLWNCAYPGIGGLPVQFRNPEGYVEFARRASVVAEKFLDNGMHFVYHNHAFELTRFPETGKSGLEILMEQCSPAVQFELDLFWVQMGGGSPFDYIRRVAGRMDVVHFKEMNGTVENRNVMAPIGCGNMPWKEIMEACDDIGVKYALIEQDNAVESDSLLCMKISHDNLAAMGGRF